MSAPDRFGAANTVMLLLIGRSRAAEGASGGLRELRDRVSE
ncbi:hypothetical protein ACIA78_28790 [Streptomyces xanthochromogenes]